MRILVGITGGIAAYKAVEVIRKFTELGHEVRVIATANAKKFIGQTTLEAISHNPVESELFHEVSDVRHIEMAQWAELIVIAPATAAFLARTYSGQAEDLLDNVIVASTAAKVIAPAMHTEMWVNPTTIRNVSGLKDLGFTLIEPEVGRLTGTDSGVGRLPDAIQIVQGALNSLKAKDLANKNVLVIAGGTHEPIDPVRFIGNRSTGKQGIALAEEALARGANVTLIAANFEYVNRDLDLIQVVTAQEVLVSAQSLISEMDLVVMPAAISDFRVETVAKEKIKKTDVGNDFAIRLIQNPDVISTLSASKKPTTKIIGFAAETISGEGLIAEATFKLERKGVDMIVANDVSNGKAFGVDTNEVVLVSKQFEPFMISGSKAEISAMIYTKALELV